MIEYNFLTGQPSDVISSLNRSLGQYKRNYSKMKVGITGRSAEERFYEHSEYQYWDKMVVLYQTTSERNANIIEDWLIENHQADLINQRLIYSSLAKGKEKIVYLLLER